jgi:hypothetical protein
MVIQDQDTFYGRCKYTGISHHQHTGHNNVAQAFETRAFYNAQ